MCVCGLPTQTAAHAERMADFALGMFAAVEKACHITGAQLQIRVGMHSGTVTAGVLLGERSRFQLFGDTVNTASRSKPRNQLHPRIIACLRFICVRCTNACMHPPV